MNCPACGRDATIENVDHLLPNSRACRLCAGRPMRAVWLAIAVSIPINVAIWRVVAWLVS